MTHSVLHFWLVRYLESSDNILSSGCG